MTHIETAMAIVDVYFSLAVPKEDDLTVRRPLYVSEGHTLELLAPHPVTIHTSHYHSTYAHTYVQDKANYTFV